MSYCPLRVASVVWRPQPGVFSLLVTCKATYQLAPGRSSLASTQDEPNTSDVYQNGDAHRSLLRGTDLVPFKRRAEIVLVGHAYAPRGEPVTSLRTRLVVGTVDKTILVFGDQSFTRDGQLVGPTRFSKSPLSWERAAGGPGTANPVGMRLDGRSDSREAVGIPSLQSPDTQVTTYQSQIEPIGYGPIAPSWPRRQVKLYARIGTWDFRRWADEPLPDDIDAGSFFNMAPLDQQLDELRADEHLVLENLHPDHPRLLTALGGHVPQAFVETSGSSAEEVRLRCDTLAIDTDRGTASLTWRGHVVLSHPTMPGRVSVRLASSPEEASRPSAGSPANLAGTVSVETAAEIQRAISELGIHASTVATAKPAATLDVDTRAAFERAVLPFREGAVPAPVECAPHPHPTRPASLTGTTDANLSLAAQAALPFAVGATPIRKAELSTTTDAVVFPANRPALPFQPNPSPWIVPLPVATDVRAPRNPTLAATVPVDTSAPAGVSVMPFESTAIKPAARTRVEPEMSTPITDPRASVPRSPWFLSRELGQGSAAPSAERADESVGILVGASAPVAATPASAASLSCVDPPLPSESEPARAAAGAIDPRLVSDEPRYALPEDAPLPLERYPVDRCARIAASVARRNEDKSGILERHDLPPERWAELSKHWREALDAEQARGKSSLLRRYDEAYVAQLEAERGPITATDYARLTVAAERGTTDQVLAELDIPRGAIPRVQRVWLKRTVDDTALGKQVRAAIERMFDE